MVEGKNKAGRPPTLSDVDRLSKWQHSMEDFVHEALQVERITGQQLRACKEVTAIIWAKIRVHNKTNHITDRDREYATKLGLSIISGQGTGKTAWLSWFILFFLVCWPRAKMGATASSGKQLKINLWSDLAKWRNDSRIKDLVTWERERIFLTEGLGQEAFCEARTFNVKQGAEEQAETLAGLHEEFMAYVIDEASGVPNPVYKPVEGGMTQMCNFAVVAFNPTRATGYAIDTQQKYRKDWVCLHWSSEASELVTKESLARDLARHGRDSNFYRIRRLGLPPVAEQGVLIPWEWIMNAVDSPLESTPDDPTIFSFDVGAGGDDSALCESCGPVIRKIDCFSSADPNALTGWALRKTFDALPRFVFVDIIGYGWAIEGNLRARYGDGETIGVNVNCEARDKSRFRRLRDELWWAVREEFQNGVISIPDDPTLIEELAAIHYKEDDNGLIKIESKQEMKERGFDSPNRADTLMMRHFYSIDEVKRMRTPQKRERQDASVNWRTV